MRMNKCSQNLKKHFLFLSAFFVLLVLKAYCAESSNWTLAAERFSFANANVKESSAIAATKVVPSLILEQMAENLMRMPKNQELLDRKLYDLRKERLSLFLQLSKEEQTRDAIFLNNYSKSVLKSKLAKSEKKIAEIQTKIDSNLLQVKAEIEDFEKKEASAAAQKKVDSDLQSSNEDSELKKLGKFFKAFVPGSQKDAEYENVVLYGNDFSKLFEPNEDVRAEGYNSYNFEKTCVDAKINALVTGKLTVYGSYISVAVTLFQFPGAKEIAHAAEVGLIDELGSIAASIAGQLTPAVVDSIPIELSFEVLPKQALESLVVGIDDVVFRNIPKNFPLNAGIHTLRFSADGYESVSTSFMFRGSQKFHVQVQLNKKSDKTISLVTKKPLLGNIVADGIDFGEVSPQNRFSQITVNNHHILGQFIDTDGNPAAFFIEQKLLSEELLQIDVKPFDRSKYIDTRRRWMYGAYTSLIISLIPKFYVYGNYYANAMAYRNSDAISYEQALKWQNADYITTGISVGCGVFFVYELIRYLVAANTVLPANAQKVSEKQLLKIQEAQKSAIEENKEKEQQKDEAKSIENLENMQSEEKSESERVEDSSILNKND